MNALVIRADGNASIGIGHTMRCFALAEAATQLGIDVHFLSVDCTPAISERCTNIGAHTHQLDTRAFSIEDSKKTAEYAKNAGVQWLIVDSYSVTKSYIARLQANGLKVLAIDDVGRADVLGADLILNQNFSAAPALYPEKNPESELLLGLEYVLMRSEFRLEHDYEPQKRILITTGGSDDTNTTPSLVEALLPTLPSDYTIHIIVGDMSPNRMALTSAYASNPRINLTCSPKEMHSEFLQAKIVITGGGSTVWECLSLGVPIITVTLAENQRAICEHLDKDDYAKTAGLVESKDFTERLNQHIHHFYERPSDFRQRAKRGMKLIDGRGVFRVLDYLQ